MQVIVSGHQMDVTAPLKEYVTDKIEKVGRHFDHVTTTNVVLHVEKNRHLAEATINAKGANPACQCRGRRHVRGNRLAG